MPDRQPICIVIRIPNVALSRSDLEKALGRPLDRFEQPTNGTLAYAQIDVPGDRDQWTAAHDCVQSIHGAIQRLLSNGQIGSPYLDIAMAFPSSAYTMSLTMPALLIAAAGRSGMAVEISVYPTEADRESENG